MAGCFMHATLLWIAFSQLQVRVVLSQPEAPAHPRYSRSATICNSWSTWIDNHHPSTTDKTERERISRADLDASCPPILGGTVTRFQCKDKRGEPFSGNRMSASNHYNASCEDVNVGVVCILLDPVNGECPDFSMQYYCHCPSNYTPPDTTTGYSTTIGTVTAMHYGHTVKVSTGYPNTTPNSQSSSTMPNSQPSSTMPNSQPSSNKPRVTKTSPTMPNSQTSTNKLRVTHTTPKMPNSQTITDKPSDTNATPTLSNAGPISARTMATNTTSRSESVGDTTIDIGGRAVSTWLVMLVSCALMFFVNCIFTLIIYRRLRSKINRYKNKTQVQPLSLV